MLFGANIALRLILIVLVALTASCRGKGAARVSEFPVADQILPADITKELTLDRFFFSGFEPADARVLNFNSSDHTPILVRLKLKY